MVAAAGISFVAAAEPCNRHAFTLLCLRHSHWLSRSQRARALPAYPEHDRRKGPWCHKTCSTHRPLLFGGGGGSGRWSSTAPRAPGECTAAFCATVCSIWAGSALHRQLCFLVVSGTRSSGQVCVPPEHGERQQMVHCNQSSGMSTGALNFLRVVQAVLAGSLVHWPNHCPARLGSSASDIECMQGGGEGGATCSRQLVLRPLLQRAIGQLHALLRLSALPPRLLPRLLRDIDKRRFLLLAERERKSRARPQDPGPQTVKAKYAAGESCSNTQHLSER